MKSAQKIKHLKLLMLCFIAYTSAVPTRALAQPTAASGLVLTDGVVVNKPRNEIYLTTPQGKVQAINLTTGRPIWQTTAKTKALNLSSGKLVVQSFDSTNSSNLIIAEIDPLQNGLVKAKKTLALPANVKADIDNNFNVKAVDVNGETLLRWQYKPITKGTYDGEDTAVVPSGTLKINRATNRLSAISASLLPPTTLTSSIAVPGGEKIKNDNSTQQFLSKDGLYILSSQKTAGDEVFNNYTWQIYERATQKLLGSLSNYNSYRAFTVSNNTLVFETGPYTQAGQNVPLQLVGYDLTTGKEIWRTEILDSYFSGQTPP